MPDNAIGDSRLPGAVRGWSMNHPKIRTALREAWAISRRLARAARLSPPFEPTEFEQLRQSAVGGGTPMAALDEPPILFLSTRGWSTHILWEATLARAAKLRGSAVVFATCGGRLPVCDAANIHGAPPMPCYSCREYAVEGLKAAGFTTLTMQDLVDVGTESRAARQRVDGLKSLAELESFSENGLELGRIVRVSLIWFMASSKIIDTPEVRALYRSFLVSAQVVARAHRALLQQVRPRAVFMLNGTFFPEAIMSELATEAGVEVVTYERGFLTDTMVVSTRTPACEYMVDEAAWTDSKGSALSAHEARQLDRYLDQRTRGEIAIDNLWPAPEFDREKLKAALELAPGRPLVAAFSNIVWDSAVQGCGIAFESLTDWVLSTIEGFADRPDCDLVVRLHPAEVRIGNHRSRERMQDLIEARFPRLPANVRVIPPESNLSSYTLMDLATIGAVFTSTSGMEMALRGLPVVVAGRTHFRGRGFTWDPDDADAYWQALDELLAHPPDPPQADANKELARRYAHLFFFRLMQRLDLVTEPQRARPQLRYSSQDALLPGQDAALDRIVDGILHGVPVVAPVSPLA